MMNKVNKHNGFYYLSAKILLCTLVLLEYIPQKTLNKINDKSINHHIFRIQPDESIMCGFYRITFIKYMVTGKTLLGYTN